MAIGFVASSNAQTNTATNALTINVPAGVADGHVMWLLTIQNNTTTTLTTPSGWTAVPGVTWPLSAGNGQVYAFYRVASSEPASYALSWSGTCKKIGVIVAYSGVDTTTPHDANAVGTTETAATGTHTTGNITTVTAQAWLLSYFADRAGTSGTWTGPTGDTVEDTRTVTGTSQCSELTADTGAGVAVGTYSKSATSTVSTSNAAMLIVAIRPATGATPVSGSDSAAATDSSSLVPDTSATDAASASETVAITADILATEQASLSEVASVTQVQTVTATDTASLGEQAGPVELGTTDQATLGESSSISQQSTTPTASDSAGLGEQASITVTLTRTDAASLAEGLAALSLPVTDTATLSETSTLAAQVAGSDGATLTDAGSVPPPQPPPRWVEHAGSGTGLADAAGGGSGLAERSSSGIAVLDRTSGSSGLADSASGGTAIIEGSGSV